MRFGVEARVPYLDHRLVEAAAALPDRLRIAQGFTKVVSEKDGPIVARIRSEIWRPAAYSPMQ